MGTLSRPLADHTPWPGHWDPLEPPAVTRTRGKRCHRLSPRSPCPQETPPRGRRVVTRVGVGGVQVTEKGRTKAKAGLEPWNSHSRGDSSKIPPNLSGDQRRAGTNLGKDIPKFPTSQSLPAHARRRRRRRRPNIELYIKLARGK